MSSEPIFEPRAVRDLCGLVNGLVFSPEDWSESGVPIIRIQNLNGRSEFNYYEGSVPEAYLIEPGTLLFAWSGNRGTSFGPFWWDGPRGALNQHIFRVVPKPGVDPRWLYQSLHLAKERAEREAHGGSGLVHVRRADLLSYKLPTPVHAEQTLIAGFLDAADAAIGQASALIAKLKLIEEGSSTGLFECGIDGRGRLRDRLAAPEAFKQTPFGLVPRPWSTPTLEELTPPDAPICYGIVQPGPDVEGGVPVLAIENLSGESPGVLHHCDPRIEARYRRSRIGAGDVLLSVKGTTGRVGQVASSFVGNISRDLARIRPSGVEPEFLCHMLASPPIQRRLQKAVVGTTRAELSIGILRQIRVPLPPKDERARITAVAESMRARIGSEEVSRDKLKLLRTGLMEGLLTGRVRAQA